LVLFWYMCIKYFKHIHSALPSTFALPLLLSPTPKQSLFYIPVWFFRAIFHIWESMWYLTFSVWLILLSMMFSSLIIFPKDIISFFLWLNKYSIMYLYHTFFIHWLMCTSVDSMFWLLWIELI
jgi:hypothetical protein